jgi:hypothetical protein
MKGKEEEVRWRLIEGSDLANIVRGRPVGGAVIRVLCSPKIGPIVVYLIPVSSEGLHVQRALKAQAKNASLKALLFPTASLTKLDVPDSGGVNGREEGSVGHLFSAQDRLPRSII